jgi:hypothetical protein
MLFIGGRNKGMVMNQGNPVVLQNVPTTLVAAHMVQVRASRILVWC